MQKDLTKLRPFDLEGWKRGEAVYDTAGHEIDFFPAVFLIRAGRADEFLRMAPRRPTVAEKLVEAMRQREAAAEFSKVVELYVDGERVFCATLPPAAADLLAAYALTHASHSV